MTCEKGENLILWKPDEERLQGGGSKPSGVKSRKMACRRNNCDYLFTPFTRFFPKEQDYKQIDTRKKNTGVGHYVIS